MEGTEAWLVMHMESAEAWRAGAGSVAPPSTTASTRTCPVALTLRNLARAAPPAEDARELTVDAAELSVVAAVVAEETSACCTASASSSARAYEGKGRGDTIPGGRPHQRLRRLCAVRIQDWRDWPSGRPLDVEERPDAMCGGEAARCDVWRRGGHSPASLPS